MKPSSTVHFFFLAIAVNCQSLQRFITVSWDSHDMHRWCEILPGEPAHGRCSSTLKPDPRHISSFMLRPPTLPLTLPLSAFVAVIYNPVLQYLVPVDDTVASIFTQRSCDHNSALIPYRRKKSHEPTQSVC